MDNSTQFKCNRVSKYEVNPRKLIFHDYMVRPRKILLPQLQIIRHFAFFKCATFIMHLDIYYI
jgi:hypothetical protein